MADGNGTQWWLRWLVGAIWGILTLALITLSTNVIANDKASRDRDGEQVKEISSVKADVREIKTDIKYMREDMLEQKAMTQKILDKLG